MRGFAATNANELWLGRGLYLLRSAALPPGAPLLEACAASLELTTADPARLVSAPIAWTLTRFGALDSERRPSAFSLQFLIVREVP